MTADKIQAEKIVTFFSELTDQLSVLNLLLKDEQSALLSKDTELLIKFAEKKSVLVDSMESNHQRMQCYIRKQLMLGEHPEEFVQWMRSQDSETSTKLIDQFNDLKSKTELVENANIVNGKFLNRQANKNRFLMKLLSGITEDSETYDLDGKKGQGYSSGKIGMA